MADGKSCIVKLIPGHRTTRRGLAFLMCAGNQDIDAKVVFDKLSQKVERTLRTRFDHWLDGKTQDDWFHGWPNDHRYRDCFVFKWKENRKNHRLYGFLCRPLLEDRRFQLCILVSHATKNTRETDPRILPRLNILKDDQAVRNAIAETAKSIVPASPR